MRIEEAIKQKKFKSTYQKAIINLMYTSNWLNDKMKQAFKPFDITPQQYNVLRILKGKYPVVCTAGEIKDVMLDKTPDLTRLVDRLVTKKLVDRRTCESNRRQVDIQITETGLKLLSEMEEVVEQHNERLNNLTDKEAELLSQILDKVRN